MNQPDRYDRFAPREGESKVTFARDQKLPNAGVFSVLREDHTAGNLLRCSLHEDPDVVFAGYRIPHPLEPLMEVRVQTTSRKTPVAAVSDALDRLSTEVDALQREFEAQVAGLRQATGQQQQQLGQGQPYPPQGQQQQQQQQPAYGGGGGGYGGGGGGYGYGGGGYGGGGGGYGAGY
jgi:DNA-directed RNA polymerase II subunit RPB11